MGLDVDALRAELTELPRVEGDDIIARGKPIAGRLCAVIETVLAESEIVEIYNWAFTVEFVLKSGDHWAIECLSPDAFPMYPGFVRGDTVVWANVWVADDMTLDDLVKQINDVAFRKNMEVSGNA